LIAAGIKDETKISEGLGRDNIRDFYELQSRINRTVGDVNFRLILKQIKAGSPPECRCTALSFKKII